MFSLLLKLKRKIKKLLKVQAESRQQTVTSLQSKTFKFLMLALFSVLIGIFYPGDALYDPLDTPRKGELAERDLLAPYQITVNKTAKEIAEEEEQARRDIPYVIDYDSTVVRSAFNGLNRYASLIDSLKNESSTESLPVDTALVNKVTRQFPLIVDSAIIKSFTIDSLDAVIDELRDIFTKDIYAIGVLPDHVTFPDQSKKNVVIRHGDRLTFYNRDKLYSYGNATLKLLKALNARSADQPIDVEFYHRIGRVFIQPNLRINMNAYNEQIKSALEEISRVKFVVEKDDPILFAGKKVTERQERILRELVRIQREDEGQGFLKSMLPVLARIILVLGAFMVLYLFLFFFRRDIYKSNPKLLAIFLIFMLQLAFVYLSDIAIDRFELSQYLYPITMLAILITILFDTEVGILANIVLAILVGILHRFDFNIAFTTIVIGTVACFMSRQVRKRSEFFKIMYSIIFAYVIFIFMVESAQLTPDSDLLYEIGFGVINGIVVPLLAIGIIPVFESLFGITTDITLLELSDLNHPLLKRLALEAPGTYHHSIIVGTLSEAAAKEIGGNSLLSRVGAYFHDIGKIEIPEYFVENQMGLKSKHEELTPSMSSIILSSHVKKGRQLGEESDIPDDVLNFIEEHHGTMIQSYFYNKALEQGMDEKSASKFRYPGPKPQTRETGIAMLADAVEAASRTLDDPKPARIDNLIQRIINDRFESGELDECPLTLKDLAKIKEAFTQILIGIFHQRIAYPKKEKTDE